MDLEGLIGRVERLLERVEHLVPQAAPAEPDWEAAAFRWRRDRSGGHLEPIRPHDPIALDDLLGVERQKALLVRNTRQFVAGLPANNALLWGSRGTGKSSLIKALLNRLADDGLRLIEVERQELVDLPQIVALTAGRPERFIVYYDDLSFEPGDPAYKALKVVLDGSLATTANLLVYASSNRRHLMPDFQSDNAETRTVEGEIHPGESIEEKVSLSDRFGLWLSFYPFDQNQYLDIVFHWLKQLDLESSEHDAVAREAIRWATARGSRSGRIALQFARDYAGRNRLPQD